jgi:chromosome segregation ATPase
MEERGKPGFLETLMRGWRPAQPDQAETEPTEAAKPTEAKAAPATKDAVKGEEGKPGEKPDEKAADKPKPEPNLQERMEGLQGWLAEIERRQRRMTRIAGGAALLAVVAAAAAIALALMTQSDSASQDDIDDLKSQLDGVTEQVTQSTQGQLKTLNDTVGSFDGRIAALEKQQTQVTADIATLRRQVNATVTQANQQATQGTTTTPAPAGGGGGQQQP